MEEVKVLYAVYSSSAVWGLGASEFEAVKEAKLYLSEGGNNYAAMKLKGELIISPVTPQAAKIIDERGGENIKITLNSEGLGEVND